MHIIPLLKHILLKETNTRLLNKIIRTAGKLKIEKMVDNIAEFIFYDDIDLKTEAVKALERIGTSKACEKLVKASKTSKIRSRVSRQKIHQIMTTPAVRSTRTESPFS